MKRLMLVRPRRPSGRLALVQAALAIALTTATPAPSMTAMHAPAADPAVQHAVDVVNALLLGQEYSLFYSGFEH